MNILFFIAHPMTEESGRKHIIFLEELKKFSDFGISFSAVSRKDISKCLRDKSEASFSYIEDRINFNREVSSETINKLIGKYNKYSLVRLALPFSGKNYFTDKSQDYFLLLYIYLEYFENLINDEGVDVAIVGPLFTSLNNSLVPIIAAVCDNHGILFRTVSKPAIRVKIDDDNSLSSKILNDIYMRKKLKGLNIKEIERTEHAIKSYINFKHSREFSHLIYKRRYLLKSNIPSVRIKKFIKFLNIKNLVKNLYLNRNYNKNYDYKNKPFFILLLNKDGNYRTNFISPYYINPISIIKNIALSLPPTHSLVVKDHPHYSSLGRVKKIVEQCDLLPNVIYIDKNIDTFDIINYADIVFSVASITGFEALFLFKHVVVFGENPYFFGAYETPVTKMENWEQLPSIIERCINNEPNRVDILTYIYSFYKSTASLVVPIDENDWSNYDIWQAGQKIMFKNAAILLGRHI